jgi:hypothetical protein
MAMRGTKTQAATISPIRTIGTGKISRHATLLVRNPMAKPSRLTRW